MDRPSRSEHPAGTASRERHERLTRPPLSALERDFENGVKLTTATNQAKKTAASIADALSRMPDSLQAELRPKLEKLQDAASYRSPESFAST